MFLVNDRPIICPMNFVKPKHFYKHVWKKDECMFKNGIEVKEFHQWIFLLLHIPMCMYKLSTYSIYDIQHTTWAFPCGCLNTTSIFQFVASCAIIFFPSRHPSHRNSLKWLVQLWLDWLTKRKGVWCHTLRMTLYKQTHENSRIYFLFG